nr:hypothetical protein [Natronolimnobius sp. AArcel1]
MFYRLLANGFLEDLQSVSGIGEKTAETIKSRL